MKIIRNDEIEYDYKYEDRTKLTRLYELKANCDDILIVKEGRITDTYYCNVALKYRGQWYTPSEPLLSGTKRAYLIDAGLIIPRDIQAKDLSQYQEIMLFNSMIEFGTSTLPLGSILM